MSIQAVNPILINDSILKFSSVIQKKTKIYIRTSDHYKIAGSQFGSNVWDLTGHMRTRNALASRRSIKFDDDVPVALGMSSAEHAGLVLTLKELIRWEHDIYKNSWESIRAATRLHFKRLMKRMVGWGIYRLSHMTPVHAEIFLIDSLHYGASYRAKTQLLLRRLYDLSQDGTIPDGLSFDPRTLDVDLGGYWVDNKAVMEGRTKPISQAVLLPILAAAILFIRRWRLPIISALCDQELGKPVDLTPFHGVLTKRALRRYGLGAMLAHMQRACYIIIASTVVGRINEFLDLDRKCHRVVSVGEQRANYVALPWSKLQAGRPIEDALAMELTGEAIQALNDTISAHSIARHSQYLFAALRQIAKNAPEIGAPVTDFSMSLGIRAFLIDIVGMSKDSAKEICSHQFRATTLLQLCGVEHGLVVAFREGRHHDIQETCRYVTSDVAQLGLVENVSSLIREAA